MAIDSIDDSVLQCKSKMRLRPVPPRHTPSFVFHRTSKLENSSLSTVESLLILTSLTSACEGPLSSAALLFFPSGSALLHHNGGREGDEGWGGRTTCLMRRSHLALVQLRLLPVRPVRIKARSRMPGWRDSTERTGVFWTHPFTPYFWALFWVNDRKLTPCKVGERSETVCPSESTRCEDGV